MNIKTEDIIKAVDDTVKAFGSNIKGQDLVDNYIEYVEQEYPSLLTSYQHRVETNPTGARAEAVTFHLFRSTIDEVKVNETQNEGGTDFLCKTGNNEFIAEVTSINTGVIENKSGLTSDLTEGITVQAFSPITQKLCNTVNNKESQMSKNNLPGILVIASDHPLADTLFDPFDAQRLLVGDMMIGFTIATNERDSNSWNETELKNSCFLQMNQGWAVCNRSISAILLMHISGVSAFVLGILHPDPKHEYSPEYLPSIPFLRLKKWPPEGNILEVEWVKYEENELVVTEPEQKTFWYDQRFN